MEILVGLSAIPILLLVLSLVLMNSNTLGYIVSIGMWLNLIVLIFLIGPQVFEVNALFSFGTGFLIDSVAALFIILTALVVAATLNHSLLFFKKEIQLQGALADSQVNSFYQFALLLYLSMIAVFLCDNLGYLWISIEATTLMSAYFVYFNRDKHALEAAWKYLIICSVGIAFALFGTVCFYVASKYGGPSGGTLNISELVAYASSLDRTYGRLAIILCFLGYGTKAGLFPLHSWLPDAYSEAPAPASAILSGALMNCALFAIFRINQISQASFDKTFSQELLIWAGALSVFAASIFLVRQHGIKRLWGYSSIENVGLMLIAIGLNSVPVFLLQAVNHSLAKVSLFLISGDIIQHAGTKELAQIKGIWTSMPLAGVIFALSAFAITGAPPFGAFISEWMLLTDSLSSGRWPLMVLVVFSLSISFVMILFHAGRILAGVSSRERVSAWQNCVVPAILVCCTLYLGVATGPQILEGFR